LSDIKGKDSTILELLASSETFNSNAGKRLREQNVEDDIAKMPEKRRRLDMDLQGNIEEMEIYESKRPMSRMQGGILKASGDFGKKRN
jgi:hypothetical protein